jgi:putative membrane protein
MPKTSFSKNSDSLARESQLWFYFVLVSLLLSGIAPVANRLTWTLDTFPVMIGLLVLWRTFSRFSLTVLSYRLLAIFALILIIGGYDSYAENPLFDWIQTEFYVVRNHDGRLVPVMNYSNGVGGGY